MSELELELDAEGASLILYWTYFDGRDGGRRGHAYLHCDGDGARFALYEHSPDPAAHALMMDRHARWERRHPLTEAQELRRRTLWRYPSASWSLSGDLGEVGELLRGRSLSFVFAPGIRDLPPLPEALLRRPLATLIGESAEGVRWPEELEAMAVCPGLSGPLVLREGRVVVVCAARYGSRFADSGQDRTAAVWRSRDGGERWEELPWKLGRAQRLSAGGRWSWPPEEIRSLRSVDPLTIEWEDPWIDWEPGTEWRAEWDPVERRWRMRPR